MAFFASLLMLASSLSLVIYFSLKLLIENTLIKLSVFTVCLHTVPKSAFFLDPKYTMKKKKQAEKTTGKHPIVRAD